MIGDDRELRATIFRATWPALVEQDEILDKVKQPFLRKHAVEQYRGAEVALVLLVVPLPLREVFPITVDKAVFGWVAVADDQEDVVVKRLRDDCASFWNASSRANSGMAGLSGASTSRRSRFRTASRSLSRPRLPPGPNVSSFHA